jgi:hypothetical protein
MIERQYIDRVVSQEMMPGIHLACPMPEFPMATIKPPMLHGRTPWHVAGDGDEERLHLHLQYAISRGLSWEVIAEHVGMDVRELKKRSPLYGDRPLSDRTVTRARLRHLTDAALGQAYDLVVPRIDPTRLRIDDIDFKSNSLLGWPVRLAVRFEIFPPEAADPTSRAGQPLLWEYRSMWRGVLNGDDLRGKPALIADAVFKAAFAEAEVYAERQWASLVAPVDAGLTR